MLAEQTLPKLPLPGTIIRVGAQTGLEVDDVAVQSALGGLALCQVKGGLSLGTTDDSPLADALDQVVAQYLAGMPEGSGRRRPQPGLDALVIVTDAAATGPVRQDLATAISRAGSLPPGTPFGSQLTRDEERALGVALGHLRGSWTARGESPSEEDLRELLAVLRMLVLNTADGGPDCATAMAMLRGLVPAGREAEAWTALVAVGHAVSEAREWRDRRRLVADLARRGVAVGPGPTLAGDIETLRAVSHSNLAALRPHVTVPIAGGIHLARAADAALAGAIHADGGVLVVGDAGTGKTGLVVTLAAGRAAAGQEVVLLRAADVAAGAVGGGVALSRPLDQALLEWTGADPATLVVDALDAARGGEDRARLAALVTALARSRWQVVATVRTYDILYGPQLRAAFAGPEIPADAAQLDDRLRGVRHLRVDDLTDAALEPVTSGDTAVSAFFSDATPSVRDLLRNPFNLRLAAELLAQGASLTPAARARLSAARTRLDLLGAYWEHRVDGAEDGFARTDVLTRIAEEMLARRRLRVLAAPPAVHGSDDAAVTGLLSDNLLALEQQPSTGTRRIVAFDHYILFDYVLMRCVLRDPLDPLRLLGRLDADPALPLVARPSFDLLFDELWEEGGDRAEFWRLALGLAGSSHLLASLAAAARLVAAGPDGAALGPLAAACTSADTSVRSAGYALLAQLVGVVRASVTPDAQVAAAAPGLASLAVSLARNAHHTTAQWDCLASTVDLLAALDRRRPLTPGQPEAAVRAEAVVDLLDACRSDPGAYEQVAVAAARQLGAAVNVDQRHARVVTGLLDDQAALSQWGGRVLAELVEAIPQVARADAALALRLARTVWAFDEPREETVALVASPLLPLTETRRDQVDMARWSLGQAFPELCRTELATAAQIFAEIANTDRFPARDAPQDRQAWPLVAGEARGWLSYGQDLGFLGGHDAATTMAAAMRDALAEAGSEGREPGPVIEVLVASLHSAPAWAAILTDAPQVDGLAAAVLPALDTGSLLAYPDTHEPAGRLLRVLASHADAAQHARLEAAVLAAGERAEAAGMRADRVTDALLGCLDPARITDEALKARLAALAAEGGPPPLITTSPVEMLFDGRTTLSDRLEASDEPVSAALQSAAEALDEDLSRLADGPADERATARERVPERFLAAHVAGAWSPTAPLAIRHDLVRAAAMLASDDRAEPGSTLGARVVAILLEAATAADAGSAQPGGDAWGRGCVTTRPAGSLRCCAGHRGAAAPKPASSVRPFEPCWSMPIRSCACRQPGASSPYPTSLPTLRQWSPLSGSICSASAIHWCSSRS
jgi:hypothetical protein